MLLTFKLLVSCRGSGEVGKPLSREYYSTESRLMIITGLITLGISVVFWCVVPPEFMSGMVDVDVRQIYQVSLP